jgi:CTP:molybdopterin cytidylyltransferase MocA
LIAADRNCIRRLIALLKHEKRIVAAEYANTLGIPALFARKFFCQLKRLESETGTKQIIFDNWAAWYGSIYRKRR